jgi:hypothetical protein
MLTTMHAFLERKNNKGKWESLDKWSYQDVDGKRQYYISKYDSTFYGDDNEFSMLFGGRKDEDNSPIIELRGLPDDISWQVKNCYSHWKNDAHSPSWFLLSELKDFDWEKKYKKKGFLDIRGYELLMNGDYPWYTFNPNWYSPIKECKEISEEEMKKVLETNEENDVILYCKTMWEQPYKSLFPYLLGLIEKLKQKGSLDSMRIVYWFDN